MRFATSIIFLSCFLQVQAQDPSKLWIGFKGSPDIVYADYFNSPKGFGNKVFPFDSNFTPRKRIGGTLGIYLSRTIQKRWAIQIGLQYGTNGDRILSGKTTGTPNPNGFTIIQTAYEEHYHWASLPVKLNYSFIAKEKFQVYLSVSGGLSLKFRESTVTQFYLDNGGVDRNNLAQGYGPLSFHPTAASGLGIRLKVSYRWAATIEPQYLGTLFWNQNLTYSSLLNSMGISLGMWKAI